MPTLPEPLHRFLNHPAVSQSWLAEQLFGENTPTNLAKLNNKRAGRQRKRFSADELSRLDQIRRNLINDLI